MSLRKFSWSMNGCWGLSCSCYTREVMRPKRVFGIGWRTAVKVVLWLWIASPLNVSVESSRFYRVQVFFLHISFRRIFEVTCEPQKYHPPRFETRRQNVLIHTLHLHISYVAGWETLKPNYLRKKFRHTARRKQRRNRNSINISKTEVFLRAAQWI